jgi:hypothetical protein
MNYTLNQLCPLIYQTRNYEAYAYKPLGPSLARILTKASKVFYKREMNKSAYLSWCTTLKHDFEFPSSFFFYNRKPYHKEQLISYLVSIFARIVLLNLETRTDGNKRISQGHRDNTSTGTYFLYIY